jgi:hypothetical protein
MEANTMGNSGTMRFNDNDDNDDTDGISISHYFQSAEMKNTNHIYLYIYMFGLPKQRGTLSTRTHNVSSPRVGVHVDSVPAYRQSQN